MNNEQRLYKQSGYEFRFADIFSSALALQWRTLSAFVRLNFSWDFVWMFKSFYLVKDFVEVF